MNNAQSTHEMAHFTTSDHRQNQPRRWIYPALLSGVVLLFFFPAFLPHRIILHRDLFYFHYPLRFYWISLVQHGHAPYINAAINGGQPLLANPNYTVFYPGNILFFVLPFRIAWNFVFALHVFWAAFGTYWLSRRLESGAFASFCGALMFACSGPLLSSLTYFNLLVASSWIPWIIGLARNAFVRGGRWIPLVSIALGLQLLSGEPTIQLVTCLLLLVGWLVASFRSSMRPRHLMTGAAIFTAALLIAAIQLMPTLFWLPNTYRGESLNFRLSQAYWSLHPARLAELFEPHYYGNTMSELESGFWGEKLSDAGYPYIMKIYFGLLPFILLPVAWKSKFGKLALALAGTFLLLALGHWTPIYHLLITILPPFRIVRYPEKFMILFAFALALTTAMGICEAQKSRVFRELLIAAAIPLIILLSLRLLAERTEQIHSTWQTIFWLILGTSVLIACGFPKLKKAALIGIPLFMIVDVYPITRDLIKTEPVSLVERKPAVINKTPDIVDRPLFHLGERQSDVYFAGGIRPELFLREALHPLTGLPWGIRYAATSDIDRMIWRTSLQREGRIQRNFPAQRAIDYMRADSIGSVVSLLPLSVPGLALQSSILLVGQRSIFTYRLNPPAAAAVRWQNGSGSISWLEREPSSLMIRINATKTGRLIVARNALPGWTCRLDRSILPWQTTAEGWLLIDVPGGQHQIELSYSPPGLIMGIALTGLGLLLALLLAVRPLRATREMALRV